jgi:hypothetical protein
LQTCGYTCSVLELVIIVNPIVCLISKLNFSIGMCVQEISVVYIVLDYTLEVAEVCTLII